MAPQQRRDRSRRLIVTAAAVVASVTLAAGPGFAVGKGPVAPAPPAPAPAIPMPPAMPPMPPIPMAPAPVASPQVTPAPVTSPRPPAKAAVPPFGVFLDSGPLGVARMAELSAWLGGSELKVAHTYLPGDRWRDIEGPPGFLDVWAHWRRDKPDRTLVLNVPMQERNEEGVSDAEVRRLLWQGAAGAFDQHFRALAERLVALKVPDTVIVLGWEMNGTTYTHRCGPDPESWKKYWNRIVTTMRAVPGQKFRFDFAPSRGRDAVPWTECYPGDSTVDIIGMDSYDQPAGESFDEQVKEPYGLQQHVDFAKAHRKPISYPEWGLFRNGDNAEYMKRMLAWFDEHKPLYNTLTDYCPHGVWQCGTNPVAARIYRAALSGIHEQPTVPVPTTPKPTPTPNPTPYKPPANCSPLDLGDWVEYWLGGKLCIRFDWWSRTR
ncbi:glycoside hydrolase family 26 protein [Streptomyces camelliae]|uniref:Glycosyl hydrolase n=1 Tax=Streptomyces camelliae TaxID=3004093 RepID=A0ABY7P9E1_9ACTN|nr:glycosyl hydrolase [Streptomyces sp. HUAS 2-6]WBO66242.1 glycosyl hydrolase [Streptomyces sp. HUAS 2-6]